MHEAIEALSATRRDILSYLKQHGGASISDLALHLGISDEGTRQHLIQLERSGWVARRDSKENGGRSGRPASHYFVSANGEVFFPKNYQELALAVLAAVAEEHGAGAVDAAMRRMADTKVREWAPRLKGRSLAQKLAILKNYYRDGDPFATVETGPTPALVERNCPYLEVANETPAVCALTVNVLSRLLGCEVKRRRTFQRGDGCCEFEVLAERPLEGDHGPAALSAETASHREK